MGMEGISVNCRPLKEDEKAWCEKHSKLAMKIAHMYVGKARQHELEDAYQVAYLGLMKASTKFDSKLGYAPSTYASVWINSYLSRFLPNQYDGVKRPPYLIDAINSLNRWRNKQFVEHGVSPNHRECAEYLKSRRASIGDKVAREVIEEVKVVSSQILASNGEMISVEDRTPAPGETPLESLERRETECNIARVIEKLSPVQKDVLTRWYGIAREQETLQQIGDSHGLSRERIRQIAAEARAKLKVHLGLIGYEYCATPNRAVLNENDEHCHEK